VKPPRRVNPDTQAVVQVEMPGWLKNLIVDAAAVQGVTVRDWCSSVLHGALVRGYGVAPAPIARAPIPTPQDALRAALSDTPTLLPCGRRGTCDGLDVPPIQLGNLSFCSVCDVRLE
jgi:hypothetical protein